MLFNVDKNAKQNMLQQYKQDALEYEQRKLQEKQKRIQEEREYLAQNQKRETEIEDRIRLDKLKRQNETIISNTESDIYPNIDPTCTLYKIQHKLIGIAAIL